MTPRICTRDTDSFYYFAFYFLGLFTKILLQTLNLFSFIKKKGYRLIVASHVTLIGIHGETEWFSWSRWAFWPSKFRCLCKRKWLWYGILFLCSTPEFVTAPIINWWHTLFLLDVELGTKKKNLKTRRSKFTKTVRISTVLCETFLERLFK